ncbi:MAG: HpsJ family protein [Limnothrix sp.]|uniref:HpsJ family protein n=1 Tax=unclassified Limnothrix TaxID=2632864 RepID=UPI000C155E5A|nr:MULTISPECIES: HpsJ family protein [unclassified Limnothrix]MEB3118254.1 HpsJ family protein [Limnothrix sp.]MBD2161124.1 hypothetical protein [Limnothrix sp. FACHB-1083]MBD2192513.1 hypothetical protein [Limnothrix sp. FACHB-1088]MBD2553243.1 hypothetical protein [Limnothrix sp. FACHB-708]MBD2590733.1 hypothetical protein [Limnothrix sp. FACHB-406]
MTKAGKRPSPPLAALIAIVVGTVLVISSLLDYLILIFPPDLQNPQWLLNTISEIVGRGIVPMVGICFLFAGLWMNSRSGLPSAKKTSLMNPRLWVLILSSALGVLFLVLSPIYINGVNKASAKEVENIEAQAKAALDQLGEPAEQFRDRLKTLLKNPQELDRLIKSGQVPPQVVQQLEQARSNPAVLDSQFNQFKQERQQEIDKRKTELVQRTKTGSMKTTLRTGLSSLVLGVGYLFMSWMGYTKRGSRARPASRAS